MKFAGCIVIALHLLALFAVSQSMLILAESEQNSGFSDADFWNDGCECIHHDHNCGCWVHIYEDNYLCANFTYLDESNGLQVKITYDNSTLMQTEISAKHPPPMCVFAIPKVDWAKVCLQFYNMHYNMNKKHISGCLEVELELFKFVPLHVYKIGCFKFPVDPSKKGSEKSKDNELLKLINETLNSFVPSVQMV